MAPTRKLDYDDLARNYALLLEWFFQISILNQSKQNAPVNLKVYCSTFAQTSLICMAKEPMWNVLSGTFSSFSMFFVMFRNFSSLVIFLLFVPSVKSQARSYSFAHVSWSTAVSKKNCNFSLRRLNYNKLQQIRMLGRTNCYGLEERSRKQK